MKAKLIYLCMIAVVIIWGFNSCDSLDSIHKEFIVPNGLSYPSKVLNAEAHPGKERVEISWQNGTDAKIVKARIFMNNYTDSVEIDINPEVKLVSRMFNGMEEGTYSFMIRTYDAKGNVSVPVEVIGDVYGEMYERSLVNRSVKNAAYNVDDVALEIEWERADIAEEGVEISFTDINGDNKTVLIDKTETNSVIPDFQFGKPVFYTTLYKPDSLAIDLFNARTIEMWYEIPPIDITPMFLKNTQMPFIAGDMIAAGRFFAVNEDWRTNPAGAINGNVDNANGDVLTIWAWEGLSPVPSVENAKLFQSVELAAGNYRFEAMIYSNPSDVDICRAYVVAASGYDLPNMDNVGQDAIEYNLIPVVAPYSNVVCSIEFTLTEQSFVSLGFVANIAGNHQLMISKVSLWQTFK